MNTPRTDGLKKSHYLTMTPYPAAYDEMVTHAQSLEMDIAAKTAQLDRVMKLLREPSGEMIEAMAEVWNESFGTRNTRYALMLNAALDKAMSAQLIKEAE